MTSTPDDAAIKVAILAAVAAVRAGSSVCPSQVARALAPDDATADGAAWRALMPRVRAVAGQLADRGQIVVTQKGQPVQAVSARGPIRLARPK
jgi:hypothetical protein